jgi:hypothetical protein
VKEQGAANGYDFDVSKTEQIFDLLLKEKQLKLPNGHKFPTTQELKGRPYCKWHNSFSHTTKDCNELRKQIQSAIEQGRLILGQYKMRVDSDPFLNVNVVNQASYSDEGGRSARRQLDFSFDVSMASPARRNDKKKEKANPSDRPQRGKKQYVTEDQVRGICYQ